MFKQLFVISLLLFISACKPVSEKGSASIAIALVPQCIDSQSQCEVSTELASFSIKFSQYQLADNVKTELPFTIELIKLPQIKTQDNVQENSQQSTEENTTKISAYLEGKDMFMGKVPVFFQQTGKNNIYLAQSLLASCSEEQMIWRLWVTAEVGEQTQTFFVDFNSQRL
ncbi:hypothetical protein [Colwellia sp. 12G3]|uniref:hypothetical protein n=1 Tax=Colwellia sp. 12G3 TaxID=2058299 RepID=UPI000C34D9B3|nr:hypothetical protein [Colwellia sp. 12G3]PKI16721.1 hypothetical protein CXF71_05530 [Colwellia sp. 12G3]